jgi:hypothetical protein
LWVEILLFFIFIIKSIFSNQVRYVCIMSVCLKSHEEAIYLQYWIISPMFNLLRKDHDSLEPAAFRNLDQQIYYSAYASFRSSSRWINLYNRNDAKAISGIAIQTFKNKILLLYRQRMEFPQFILNTLLPSTRNL